jgi:hypothetical protein
LVERKKESSSRTSVLGHRRRLCLFPAGASHLPFAEAHELRIFCAQFPEGKYRSFPSSSSSSSSLPFHVKSQKQNPEKDKRPTSRSSTFPCLPASFITPALLVSFPSSQVSLACITSFLPSFFPCLPGASSRCSCGVFLPLPPSLFITGSTTSSSHFYFSSSSCFVLP